MKSKIYLIEMLPYSYKINTFHFLSINSQYQFPVSIFNIKQRKQRIFFYYALLFIYFLYINL